MREILFFLLIPFTILSQPNFTVTTSDNASLKNLFIKPVGQGPNKPVMIIDTSGEVLFFENYGMAGWDWKVNMNNHLTFYDRQNNSWLVMDVFQNIVDTVYAQNGYTADNHDFLALQNGNYVILIYDSQPYPMDNIVEGGDPDAIVEGLIIQELDSEHNVIFQWESWDHFNVTDNTSLDLTGNSIAFIHANSIDIDYDGNFLISSRNLDEITKIDRESGEIIWRFGGSQNDFEFINDYPFSRQHCIKSLGSNKYLLYDNGNLSSNYTGGNNVSRAVEYELDLDLMTATKVWDFIHPDSLFTPTIGSVQRLENGNTLVNFGNLSIINRGAVIVEVTPDKEIAFQLELDTVSNGSSNVYCANKFDWFFDDSIIGCDNLNACNYEINTINNDSACLLPGDTCELFTVEEILTGILNDNCECITENNSLLHELDYNKELVKIVNLMGKEIYYNNKIQTLLYIYSDGSIERKIIY